MSWKSRRWKLEEVKDVVLCIVCGDNLDKTSGL